MRGMKCGVEGGKGMEVESERNEMGMELGWREGKRNGGEVCEE